MEPRTVLMAMDAFRICLGMRPKNYGAKEVGQFFRRRLRAILSGGGR